MLHYQFYNKSNNGNAPVYIFLGGFTATYEAWYKVSDLILNQQDCTILLIDNIGAGKSPQPSGKYTTMQMATMIVDIVSHLNLNKVNLIGHSMGGAIAQHIAIMSPHLINHLYLLSTATKFNEVTKLFLINRHDLAKSNINRELIAKTVIPTIFCNAFLTKQENINLAINRVVNNPQTLDGLFGQLNACLTHDTTEIIHKISCSTTIITGNEDVLVNPINSKNLHNMIPNSTLHIIDNTAHMLQLEQPQKITEIILE